MTDKKISEEKEYWEDIDVVHSYTRKQAIEDGDLVQVDAQLSSQAGLKWPVAIHRNVWDKYVEWTKEDNRRQTFQNTKGRLWDVLFMLSMAIRLARNKEGDRLRFRLNIIPRGQKSRAKNPRLTYLWALFHPGDNHEPVITILENLNDE